MDDREVLSIKRVFDELFHFARQYCATDSYGGLLKFIAGFRFCSPFVALVKGSTPPAAAASTGMMGCKKSFGTM